MTSKIRCTSCSYSSCALEKLAIHELEKMETTTYQSSFSRGEMIRKQDTPYNSIIYLRKGYIKEYLYHDNSADQVIQIIKPMSYIGLMGVYSNANATSLYSYKAITDVELCFIDKPTFSDLVTGNGAFASEILYALSEESMKNHHRFLSLNKNQTYGKVAGLLLYLSENVFEDSKFEIWLSRTEMAQMIASTRESVTRALGWFQKENLINLNRNKISIIDSARLSRISEKG